ncbi:carbohydrate-binding protein [Vreelandella titanicae]|uniref:carbohydrate-binding protein n=1 Tax=Vreelandella titanicae TaxID=664683 RepID=UPI003D2AE9EA
MFSISWVDAASGEVQRGLNSAQTVAVDEIENSAIRIIPIINTPLDSLSLTESIELTIINSEGESLTLTKTSPPFIFDNLPNLTNGDVQLLISALDSGGNLIEAGSEAVTFEVTESLPVPPVFIPIRIQAEDTDNTDGDSNYAVMTGGVTTSAVGEPNAVNADGNAYADFVGPSGETLTFNIDVPEAGEYELAVSYALSRNNDAVASERNRPLRLEVNDQLVDRMFDLRSTSPEGNNNASDFTTFAERTIIVQLQEGQNSVSFTSNGLSGPNVDYLEIRKPALGSQVIQGEELFLSPEPDLTPDGIDTNRPVTTANIVSLNDTFRVGAEEASYLDWAFGNVDAYGEFVYQAPVAGTYSMTVTYASSSGRPLDLSLVEGSGLTSIGTFAFAETTPALYMPDDLDDLPSGVTTSTPAATQWEGWTTETLEFTLAAGENLLRLGGRANGPNIDKIEMALVAAEPSAPTALLLDNNSVLENQEGAVIGQLIVEDQDDDTHSFTVSDERFEVDVSGVLRLKSGTSLDFETTTSVSVEITATDPAGASVSETFVIAVGDVEDSVTPPPEPADPIRLQAEAFDTATIFTIENIAAADGGQAIRLPGSSEGTASYALDGKVAAGTYTIIVGYIDESDGESTAQLSISNAEGESFSGDWTFDDDADSGNGVQPQNFRTATFTDVTVGDDATLSLSASSTALEYARIDYIEFVPTGSVDPEPTILLGIADADPVVESGDEGVTTLSFALSASNAFSGDVELTLEINGVADTRTVTFTDGVATLAVDVANDDEDNGSETVTVALIGATGDSFAIDSAAATASGSVSEDDEAVVPADPIRLQAEAFDTATTFTIENIAAADGGQAIRLPGNSEGTASYALEGKVAAGTYTVIVGYVDESDGESTAQLSIGNADGESFSGSWTFDDDADSGNGVQPQNFRTATFADVTVGDDATLSLSASSTALEYARIDYIEFVPTDSGEPEPTILLGIADADPVVESGDEGVTTLSFALSASNAFSGDVELTLEINGVADTRTVTFTDGVATLAVDVANDDEDNGSETVTVALIGATGDSFAIDSAAATASGSVSEDDEAVVPADPIRLQAEAFDTATTFTIENIAAADGGQAIRLPGNSEGTASYALEGKVAAGTYTVIVGYVDESDGESTAQLSIGNADGESFSGSWTFDDDADSGNGVQPQNFRTATFADVTVGDDATLSLSASSTALEYARIDYIEFVPTDSGEPEPTILLGIADADPVVESGDEGVTTLSFALSASNAFSGDVELALEIDGVADTRTVTFIDGAATLAVDVANDDEDNGSENVTVALIGATGDSFAIDSAAATASGSVSEDDAVPDTVAPIVIQAEDAALVTVNDSGLPSNADFTRVVDPNNPDAFTNYREGAVGGAYMDFGTNPGDEVIFNVETEVAGTYTAVIRYANGSAGPRPLDLMINGTPVPQAAFPPAVNDGVNDPWDSWLELEVEMELQAGPNSVSFAIPAVADGGVNNGPNIDQIIFNYQQDDGGETPTGPFLFEIQGEALTIDDDEPTPDTMVRDASNPETNAAAGPDGLWDGFTGSGYLDMGNEAGDAAFFEVAVEEAGTYTLNVRYANGDGAGASRPMTLLVGGAPQGQLAFPTTGAGNDGWVNWQDATIELELMAGNNTIRLENVGNAGPNIDSLSVSREGTQEPPVVEPGERFAVKINFEPDGFATPEGYIADTGLAFGDQSVEIDGQVYQYGWVTEASIADGTENGTIPMAINTLSSVAVNDRTDEIAGLDPRQGTYAHFDQPAEGYVRAGWEMELDDGYYEVTISIGDTSGPYDSVNLINAEGEQFSTPFTPFRPDDFPADNSPSNDTEGFRSELVTRVVQVTDGRLTLDSIGLGDNTEVQYIEIQSIPDLTPEDDREAPEDYAFFTDPRAIAGVGENEIRVELDAEDGTPPTGVDPDSDIFVGISVVDGRGGALLESLGDGSVRLFETVSGEEVALNVNTTGGFDSLTISPNSMLKEFTSYTLVIEGFQDRGANDNPDAPTREFQKFTNTFITGEASEIVPREVAFNDVIELNGAADNAYQFTSLELSPDGSKMYISNMLGEIKRYDVNPQTGALSNEQVLALDYFAGDSAGSRGIIGLTFDPTDPNVLWVSDNYPIPLEGRDNGVPDFSGRISKITLEEGDAFNATAEAYITGLPRSNGDHVTNSLEFRANPEFDANTNPDVPSHLLYLLQGSNSAMGAPDSAWGNRPERLLSAAVMEIDPTREAPAGGFDVTTEPLPEDGFNRRFTDDDGVDFKADPIAMGDDRFLVFAANGTATVEDSDGNLIESYYDPFADDAVVKIFATGVRNAYDLVWHSNGNLYVPTNGSAAGGNVPDDPSTPQNEYVGNVEKQDDYLFTVKEGGYYGHPNPLRDEFILNGGNPTAGNDANQVGNYPAGQDPDPNYDIEGVYSLGENRSPNGVTEYTSGVFGGNLQGSVLFTEYSGGDDIRSITFDAAGNITGDEVLRDVNGNVITYIDPLDIIENPATGQLYLLTLNRNNGQSQIIRLDPAPGGVIVDPEEPDDELVSLLTIQAEDNTPNDGTSVSIAQGGGAEIQIRTVNNPEANQPTGVRPGAFGLDGNNDDTDGVLGGYADFGSTNSDFITFSFELSGADAGDSVLRVRYGNGDTVNRPLEVFVNNVSVGTFGFSPPAGVTGDDAWNEWLTLDIPASLVSGLNTVRFQAVNNTGPNIDQLEILQAPEDTSPGYTDYEAENAQLDGPVIITNSEDDRNASGEGFVDFNGTSDQSITWTVEVDEAGTYDVGFRYALAASKADRPMVVTVNGIDIGTLNFPGQSNEAEDNWFFQSTELTLGTGSNTITVTAPGANGPNVDLLRIADTPLDTFEPVYADIDGSGRIELESGDSARAVNDRTADFYFTVNEDGAYKLDLAANAGAPDGGALTLLLNGQPVDEMSFPGVGEAGEQSAYIELQAGLTYNLRVVSTADGVDEIDYLDISPAPGDPDAGIGIQSNDAAYYSDRLHFSYLENDSASNPNRDYKEDATVTISNTGTNELVFIDADLDGPFTLVDPDIFAGLTLAAGESIDVQVLFDRAAYTPPTNDAGDGVFEGTLRLVTNDADTPVAEVHLAGFWQARDEGGWEPNVNEVWEVFGFGNVIQGLTTVGGGENSVLNDFDLYRPVNDDEVMSRYWKIADGFESATITQLAAYHGNGGATLGIHNPGNKNQDIILSDHAGDNNQSLLPIKANGQFATATFTRDQIPDGWIGNDIFGIEVANLSTDPSLNPTGGGTVPPGAEDIERGYTVRVFQALDANGNVIPNTYLGVMDYTGINYDYNDNMFVIEGISPVSGGEISITNLDGVPSDDRLVMSRIENPANASQVFHDESTFTITNDGFADLEISSLAISDPSLFEIVGATENLLIPAGGTLDVTVRFIAEDFDDGTLYESTLIINSNDGDEGTKTIQLAGIAQGQSENGQEPLVQEIIDAFGFSTNVAEGQMNQGGLVEANGDEILSPYFQRADGQSPIKITQLAAYHTQGDVARLFIHDVDSRDRDEILAHDEQDGQTLLPRALNSGDLLTTTTLDRDAPFGFFADITGRQGYISWSDPDANLYEDTIDAIGSPGTNLNWDENDGHLIRVYVAKDAAGNVIPNTYIVIQDYAGVNYDYNDNIFLVENVQTYDPTGVEDADGNGRIDLYDDSDGDGIPNFLDDQAPVEQTAYNTGETPWTLGAGGLTLEAKLFDNGGQGVAYNDTTTAHQGAAFRSDEAVDISNGTEALGYIADGEWVEYTLNVETAGTYALSFLTSATSNGKSITAAFEQDGNFQSSASINLPNTGSFTSFQTVGPLEFDLDAGEQVLRLTFNGGQLDLQSFSFEAIDLGEEEQQPFNTNQTPWLVEDEGLVLDAVNYDSGGQDVAYNDSSENQEGSNFRGDGVDIVGDGSAIGWIENNEWVEYTLNVAQAGTYELSFLSALGSTGGAARSITASFAQGDSPYTTASPVSVNYSGSWTTFVPTDSVQVELEAGEQVLRLTFNGGSQDLASFSLAPITTIGSQIPFNDSGTPWEVGDSFTLDAALFDVGGEGISYSDSDPQQEGSNFREGGVDIVGNGTAIGWVDVGEWVEYTIDVAQSGTYSLSFLASTPSSDVTITAAVEKNGAFYLEASSPPLPNTGSWSNPVASDGMLLDLQAGEQTLRLTFNGSAGSDLMDFQSFTLERENVQQAFNEEGTPWLIDDDGLFLDAINYDQGGAGIAYNDSSETQLGNASIRGEGVDIVGDGEAIGWIANNEWVEYTVDVVEAGEHTFSFITATPWSGRSITVAAEKDGVFYAQASPLSVPNSGDWGNYVQGPEVTLNLQEGEQVVRLTFNGGSMDLQSLIIEQSENQPSALSLNSGEDALGVTGVQEPSTSELLF